MRDPNNHSPSADDDIAFGEDLSRQVYCILGVPVDVVDLAQALRCIDSAARRGARLFLSTPNLNFFNMSWYDVEFRRSVLVSDLCLPDGMPVVWMGKLLGVPIRERIAGSDILGALRGQKNARDRLRLYFFGGDEGVAEAAGRAFNEPGSGARCVGWMNPGFLPVEAMSGDAIIDDINASGADFLIVSLGAKKGQSWLMRNSDRLCVPVRSHFGASLNFEAGRVRRAPEFLQRTGMEWLWRIKEEPHLWRRYLADGVAFLRVLYTNVAPIVIHGWMTAAAARKPLAIDRATDPFGAVTIALAGAATARSVDRLIVAFEGALDAVGRITIDMSGVTAVDPRFLGLLVVYRRKVERAKLRLVFVGVSDGLKDQFRRHRAEFLVEPAPDPGAGSSKPADMPLSTARTV